MAAAGLCQAGRHQIVYRGIDAAVWARLDAFEGPDYERVQVEVALPDGQIVPVAHRLGRAPAWVGVSVPRGPVSAGYVEEVRDSADRARVVALRATGYGATITVDLAVL